MAPSHREAGHGVCGRSVNYPHWQYTSAFSARLELRKQCNETMTAWGGQRTSSLLWLHPSLTEQPVKEIHRGGDLFYTRSRIVS